MKLYNISLQSLRRRKSRTAFLIIGLLLSVASFVTLYVVSENVNKSVSENLDEFGANMIITPRTDGLNLNYGGISVTGLTLDNNSLNLEDIDKIKSIKNKDNLSVIAPKLFNSVKILTLNGTNEKNMVAAGINFKDEIRLKKWWRVTGKYPSQENEILMGSEASKLLEIKLNQKTSLNGEEFLISGILEETGSQDDGLIFLDLKKSQELFNKKNELSLIEIAARCYDCPIEEIVRQASGKLPGAKVTAIKQSIESKMTAIHRFEHFSLGISAVILVISLLIVFTNVNASVNERTKEIGILMSVGFRRWHIIKIILLEVLIASFSAGVIGFFIGIAGAKIITPILSMDDSITINFSYSLLLLSAGMAVTAGLLASVLPALKAARLDPTVAFRSL
ncbi:MAG: FtsX-like permease family protein [Ignavibacterium sp.]|jgi:putative ABC transport system permease protein|nr:MAG: FtsX-like permease family protein [Ignavibacterium sp.]MDD5609239.1 FtsX-like permease family protein [Ignavibacterium sp.]MEB2297349.1 FtsX-like permease family protein [Ignavibacteria bacterium]